VNQVNGRLGPGLSAACGFANQDRSYTRYIQDAESRSRDTEPVIESRSVAEPRSRETEAVIESRSVAESRSRETEAVIESRSVAESRSHDTEPVIESRCVAESRSRKRHTTETPAPDPASAQNLDELRAILRACFLRESHDLYGLEDGPWIDRATQNWFDDSTNYDRRWRVIDARRPGAGRILDMASGCGTFLLYGLNRGRDVFGIEPEPWKRRYFRKKVELSGYSAAYLSRLVPAVGERLPFADASFDLVTTFQTLEHVADVGSCISEMLRVLRPGGVLYLRAPDYNCFFEPHYRLPFLPRMHRPLAEWYLGRMERPLAGLRTLNWTTERSIIKLLRNQPGRLQIECNRYFFIEQRRREVEGTLSPLLRRLGTARLLNETHQLKRKLGAWMKVGRQERVIDLWITKVPPLSRR
jgi:ubiquinone/menaquinone biosynthesis C-methylase UbiE